AFPRGERILVDTTLGWRLTNPRMTDLGYHPISLGETAENVAAKEHVGRPEQDSYAARSQDRYARAKADGFFTGEIQAVHNGTELVSEDEHPRASSTIEKLRTHRHRARRVRRDRAERGLRGPGDPMHSRAWTAGRSHQSERRRHRDRPPDRGIGRAARGHAAPRARAARRSLRHRHDVHRCRAGPGDALRTGVLTRAILTAV